jgi:hypothetical protein
VYKPNFFGENLPSKIGVRLIQGIKKNRDPPRKSRYHIDDWAHDALLYVVKPPVKTVRSRHLRFPEVGRPWHHWQITVNAASDNQSAANAIANILLSHRWNLVRFIYELLFPNSWPKNLGAAYTRANKAFSIFKNKVHIILMQRDAWYKTWYMRGVSYAILTLRNRAVV